MTQPSSKSTFPELETPSLILRRLLIEDAPILHEYWTDPVVTEFLVLDPFEKLEQTVDMIQLLDGLFDQDIGIRWGIVLKADRTLAGTCGFHNLKPEHRRAEIGFELGRAFWGRRIMTEAAAAILAYGFQARGFNRIEAFVNDGNARSAGILTKLGFRHDGLLREYEFARGRFVDQHCYSLLQSDYNRKA